MATDAKELERKAPGRRRIDLSGQRFGKLTVVAFGRKAPGYITWSCSCDCGRTVEVNAGSTISVIKTRSSWAHL